MRHARRGSFGSCAAAEAWLAQIYEEQPPLHPGCPTCVCAHVRRA